MAGSDPRFNAAAFRTAIQSTMQMGFPDEQSQQITWVWVPEYKYNSTPDPGGFPLDWSAAEIKTTEDIAPIIVNCAVQFTATTTTSRIGGTDLGVMDVENAIVTLLDVDYDSLVTHGSGVFPQRASLNGSVYVTQFIGPPFGIFDVTLYTVYLQSVDASS